METLSRNNYLAECLEVITEGPINRESRHSKLEGNDMSNTRRVTDQKEILTPAVAAKASFHELPVNFNFTHSLKSGVGDGEQGLVSPLVSGVERHRCARSDEISNAEGRDGQKMSHQKTRGRSVQSQKPLHRWCLRCLVEIRLLPWYDLRHTGLHKDAVES